MADGLTPDVLKPDGLKPDVLQPGVLTPDGVALKDLQQRVAQAAADGTALRIRGGGSKDFYGQPGTGKILDTRGYRGVVEYEPTELVLTARCGTPLAEVEQLLADHGQMLAFEPPHFGPHATLGGCVATGLSGPRRQTAGSLRDFVLGAKLLDGRAQVLSFGGQVMKNVAGYDLSRALAGSLGILGVILEASIKVLPVPAACVTLQFELNEATALNTLNRHAGLPLPITASAWHAGRLRLRLAGAGAAVRAAQDRLGGERIADTEAEAYWLSLREQTHPFFGASARDAANAEASREDPPLWRLSVTSTSAPVELPGEQLIEWGGALRWWKTLAAPEQVRAEAGGRDSTRGHATLFRAAAPLRASTDVFEPLAPALMKIHRTLKAEFDPAGIFNRGRLYADL